VGKETLRQWMHEAGLWQVRRKRLRRCHPPRERRPRRGELVQIDGSPHDWFEGRALRCTLIAFIDPALGLNDSPLAGAGLRPAPARGGSSPSTGHLYQAQQADITNVPNYRTLLMSLDSVAKAS